MICHDKRFHCVVPSLHQCINVTDSRWSGLEMLQACNLQVVTPRCTLSVARNEVSELSPSDDESERWFHWLTGWHHHQHRQSASSIYVKATKWIVWWFKTVAVQKHMPYAHAYNICCIVMLVALCLQGYSWEPPWKYGDPCRSSFHHLLGVRHFGTWFKVNNPNTRSPTHL